VKWKTRQEEEEEEEEGGGYGGLTSETGETYNSKLQQ
jgi:hypothetical protein